MENLTNEICEFRELSINEVERVIGGGIAKAVVCTSGGALGGVLTGLKAGGVLTPVFGPIALPACVAIATTGGAMGGFVLGW